jgi:hypothetical protein
MDINTLPSYLRDLLTEVSLMDEEAFPPTLEVQPKEKLLGVVEDVWVRKLFATCTMHKREGERAKVECKYTDHSDGKNCEHAAVVNSHEYRADVCGKLFWTINNEHFRVWGDGGTLGLRKGWKIVWDDNDDDGDGLIIGGIDQLPGAIRKALLRRLKEG